MGNRYTVTTARANFGAIIAQVEAGLEISLTRRGNPVAVVVPVRQEQRPRGDRLGFAEVYRSFLARHSLKEIGADDDFVASIRNGDTGREVLL